jgi:translation initiation factor 2 alpha subunit (eIF-2alpha)
MKYNEGDVVFCKVVKIEGTTVFVEVEGGVPGSLVLSEVAAGRIRNLRAYVSPNRKIVCKVLKIAKDHLELSLRRVTAKERDEMLISHKKERALSNMLKTIGEKPREIINKIKEEYDIPEFLLEAREDIKVIEQFIDKGKAKKLFQIISEKEEREKVVKRKFVLKSYSDSGVKDLKEILNVENIDVKYVGSSIFSISVSGRDFKEAEARLGDIFEEIEKRAEKKKAIFKIKKEK